MPPRRLWRFLPAKMSSNTLAIDTNPFTAPHIDDVIVTDTGCVLGDTLEMNVVIYDDNQGTNPQVVNCTVFRFQGAVPP